MSVAPAYSAAQVALDGSLLDHVSSTALTTSGTISVSSDADGDYIEAATQPTNYVNLGLLARPTPGTTWVVELKTTASAIVCIEGTANTGSSLIEGIYLNASDHLASTVLSGCIGFFLRGTNGSVKYWRTDNIGINDGEKHTVAIEYADDGSVSISVDGTSQTVTSSGTGGEPTVASGNVEFTIALFARNARGTRDMLATGKVYRFARLGADGYDIDDLSADASILFGTPDSTAPTLTFATATATGATTATASVTTDEGNGTLYFLASENATESAATIKAALSQSVTATGEQSISLSALDAETTYYVHFVHVDAASNESNVITSAAITTPAIVYPVLSGASATATGTDSVEASVTTDSAGGTLYAVLTTSSTQPSAAQIKAGTDHEDEAATATNTATVTTAGEYDVEATGLDSRTTYYWHFVHTDGDSLDSNVISVAVTTQDISIALSFDDAAPAYLQAFLATSNLTMGDAELKVLLDGE